MKFLVLTLAVILDIAPAGQAFVTMLQKRDSILVGDRIEYGFILDSLSRGTQLSVPDFTKASNDTLTVIRSWQVDTLIDGKRMTGKALRKIMGKGRSFSVRAGMVLTPFEEGKYMLPDLPVVKMRAGRSDTLLFSGSEIEVSQIPIDTSTFVIKDLKGQIAYPVTFRELVPWIAGVVLLAALIVLAVWLVRRFMARRSGAAGAQKDPAYIVALRELDKYRSDKFWTAEKQKTFYSGVTDALKFYMEDRFGVDAPEMTTAELFDALKGEKDLSPELYSEVRNLFETADFVKFAKHVVADEDNARVLPTAVRFVTDTYQAELEEEQKKDVL